MVDQSPVGLEAHSRGQWAVHACTGDAIARGMIFNASVIEFQPISRSLGTEPLFPVPLYSHMKLKTTSILLLCAAFMTACSTPASFHSMTDKWGWTNTSPDKDPPFGVHPKPPVPGAPVPAPVVVAAPAKPTPGSDIGTASMKVDPKTIAAPPKQSLTPELVLPTEPKQ